MIAAAFRALQLKRPGGRYVYYGVEVSCRAEGIVSDFCGTAGTVKVSWRHPNHALLCAASTARIRSASASLDSRAARDADRAAAVWAGIFFGFLLLIGILNVLAEATESWRESWQKCQHGVAGGARSKKDF
jgi:hypothetical protein